MLQIMEMQEQIQWDIFLSLWMNFIFESSETWNRQFASTETGGTGRKTDGILFFPERSKYRKGYDDRTLGDDGTSYHEAI